MSQALQEIIVGSTSRHKLTAVELACIDLDIDATVSGMKTKSYENDMPVGIDEIYRGACARVNQVKIVHPEVLAIGIESGIISADVPCGAPVFDTSVIVVITPDNRQFMALSSGIAFPKEYVAIARERGFKTTTVGAVIAEKLGGDSTDPHLIITKGAVSRSDTLIHGIINALKQM